MDPVIQTDRLTLRRPEEPDAAGLARFINDFEVARQTGTIPHPYTPLHAEAWIMTRSAFWRRGLERAYVITRGGALIGSVALFRPSVDAPFSLGYMLSRDQWGRGYMSEAVAAVLGEAARAGVERIVATVFADNPASSRVLEKLCFQPSRNGRSFSMARMERAPVIEYIWTNGAAA